MIFPSGTSGALAQVGFWRYTGWPGANPVFFYESGAHDAGVPMNWHTGAPTGVTHRFWVQWVTTGCPSGLTICFAFNIDTTRLTVSNFDPDMAWGDPFGQNAWNMAFMGEVHNPSSDIMGYNSGGVATVWSSAQAQDWSTNQYRNFTCNLYEEVDSTRYGLNSGAGGCGTWSTYTKVG